MGQSTETERLNGRVKLGGEQWWTANAGKKGTIAGLDHQLREEYGEIDQVEGVSVSGLVERLSTLLAWLCYYILLLSTWGGMGRDLCAWISRRSRYKSVFMRPPKGYARLLSHVETFYHRRLYSRISDLWNRPICTAPGARIDVLSRVQKGGKLVVQPDQKKSCINIGSYNYLGFADDWLQTCGAYVLGTLDRYPPAMSCSRADVGTTSVHKDLEQSIARFLKKDDAIVFNMGFATNATGIPSITKKGDLIISDRLNHTSIVSGCRSSGAFIRTFKHNDTEDLERLLREAISTGVPRTRRVWRRIFVVIEGVYSMEGEVCKLKEIVKLCKKYKAYIYLDEAHSIGALGSTGRGVTEYTGVDPADIDILMGTFTKSFGAMGGYITASQEMIDYMRNDCTSQAYHTAMSPVAASQVLRALSIISGEDGTDLGQRKIKRLHYNSDYLRSQLVKRGYHVLGDYGSPVIPLMIYHLGKLGYFSRECLKRGLALVVVGFPATEILLSRCRFCVSSAHTRKDLDELLEIVDEVADTAHLRYNQSIIG